MPVQRHSWNERSFQQNHLKRCWAGILIILAVWLSSCQVLPAVEQGEPVFIPPTAPKPVGTSEFPSPTPAITPTAEATLIPTATPDCTNELRYEEDLTIPDGALVSPGQILDKRWLVTNSGTCNWDGRYRLVLIAGPDLSAATEQGLYPARSGTTVTIQVIYTAPNEPGVYRSAWQAQSPNGEAFGDPIFVEVTVGQQP